MGWVVTIKQKPLWDLRRTIAWCPIWYLFWIFGWIPDAQKWYIFYQKIAIERFFLSAFFRNRALNWGLISKIMVT